MAELFSSTSKLAGQQAALKSGSWRRRILATLRERPSALFEVAALYGVPDHTISGRFTELAKDGHIEHAGERRKHPVSGCDAEVWRIRGAASAPQPDVAELLGYPLALKIGGDMFDRQPLLPSESYPGIPYARRADAGGLRQAVRVELVECPGCGKPLKFIQEPPAAGKKFRCGTPSCNTTWEVAIVAEPGQPQIVALVLKTF